MQDIDCGEFRKLLTILVNVARRNLQIFVVLVPISQLVQDSRSGGQEIVLVVIERGENGSEGFNIIRD